MFAYMLSRGQPMRGRAFVMTEHLLNLSASCNEPVNEADDYSVSSE